MRSTTIQYRPTMQFIILFWKRNTQSNLLNNIKSFRCEHSIRAAVIYTIRCNGLQIFIIINFLQHGVQNSHRLHRNVYRVQCTLCLYTLLSKNTVSLVFDCKRVLSGYRSALRVVRSRLDLRRVSLTLLALFCIRGVAYKS